MQDERHVLKQVPFGKTDGKIKEENPKEDEQTTWWIGARKILAPCTEWRRTEVQNQVQPTCAICRAQQRAVSRWSRP